MMLEISQYLENYLWPYFDADTASTAHVMSILVSLVCGNASALGTFAGHYRNPSCFGCMHRKGFMNVNTCLCLLCMHRPWSMRSSEENVPAWNSFEQQREQIPLPSLRGCWACWAWEDALQPHA